MLQEKEIVNISTAADSAAALRSVQRFLRHNGYKRDKKSNAISYRLGDNVRQMRDAYVKRMMCELNANQTQRKRCVYLDESYIHHNYKRHDDHSMIRTTNKMSKSKSHTKGVDFALLAQL